MGDVGANVGNSGVGLKVKVFGIGRAQARRRVVAATTIASVAVAIGGMQMLGAFAAGSASRPVDRELSSYVLFAFDTLNFKGGEAPGRGVIHGGNVGAGGIDSTPDNSSPILNFCANNPVTMDEGTQVNADTMRITNLCHVWDVYANKLTAGSNVVPVNSGPTSFSTPLLNAMPVIPAFNCNANNPVKINKGATATLPPGTYGNAVFEDQTNVTLQPGIYNFCDLHVGRNAVVKTVAGVEIRIAATFSISNGTVFGSVCDIPIYVRADGHASTNDVAINFAKHTDVFGKFLTLLGKIALGDDTNLNGQFVGNAIISDKNVNVNGCNNSNTTTSSWTSPSTSSSSTSPSTSTSTSTLPEEASTSSSTSTTSTTVEPITTTIPGTSRRSTTTSTIVVPETTVGSQATTVPNPVTPNDTPSNGGGGSLPFTGSGSGLLHFVLFAFVAGGVLLGLSRRRWA